MSTQATGGKDIASILKCPLTRQTISRLLQIFLLGYYFVFLCKYEKDVMFYSNEYLACELLLKLIVSFSQNQIMDCCLAVNTCLGHIFSAKVLFLFFMCIYSYSFNPQYTKK